MGWEPCYSKTIPQRAHSSNPETRIKAVYICFIYVIHTYSLFIDWVKDSKTINSCKRRVSNVQCMHYTQKTNLRIEKRLFTAWKDYLPVEKDYLRL